MDRDRTQRAVARIEAALARIEAAARHVPAPGAVPDADAGGDLAARHARLRAAVTQSLGQLDRLIAEHGG